MGIRDSFVDLGAQKLVAAEKGTRKIAVEIKSFLSPSLLQDLERALGQFILYRAFLSRVDPDRALYLALPEATMEGIFADKIADVLEAVMQVAQEISEYELERGKPLPSKNHGIVQFNVSLAFGRYAEKYSFIPELSLELDGESLVPDISVFPKLAVDRQRRTRSSLIAESLPDSPIPVDVAFSE